MPTRSIGLGLAIALAGGIAVAGATVHTVTVGDDFFSPSRLDIDPGDTVRWTNAAGFHNVFSCNAGQLGCDGADANELFSSGEPAPGIWVYQYTFQSPGVNPYICQAHATSMSGVVNVGVATGPPRVPDGGAGAPVTVAKLDPDGGTLAIAWDTSCPGADDYQILHSTGARLPDNPGGTYKLVGATCAIGTASPYVWSGTPHPGSDPDGLIWFVVVAVSSSPAEGSWGTDSTGADRTGQGPDGSSAWCGVTTSDLDNTCSP